MKSLILCIVLSFLFQSAHMVDWYVGSVDNNKHFWTYPASEVYLHVQDRCKWAGMDLATIDSAEENALLANYLINQGNFTIAQKMFWTGASDLGTEGIWRWHKNFDEPMGYTNWYTGSTPPLNYSRNCMTLHPSGLWFDTECSFNWNDLYGGFYPLCQSYDVPPPKKNQINHAKKPKSSSFTQPMNMNLIGQASDKVFWIEENMDPTGTSALWDYCQQRGLHHVSVESKEEFELIMGYLKSHGVTLPVATSAVEYYADYFYWMRRGERIVNSSYIEVGEPVIGQRTTSLCIYPVENIIKYCSLFAYKSISAICEIDV